MQAPNPNCSDVPVLILTPAGNDARNATEVLEKVGVRTEICANVQELCDRAGEQSGAFLISEETLSDHGLACLLDFLVRQPPWSDLPLVLLTAAGEIKSKTYRILNFLGARANVTLLEKPLRAMTLISVIRASLRSRHRQFEIRDLLKSYAQAGEAAQKATAKFRALFDQSSTFSGIMSLDGSVIEANRLCLEGCGYRADEVLGRPFWECGWWRHSKKVQQKLREGTLQAAQGTPYLELLPYVWADGSKHVVEFGLYPIRDHAGQVIFLHPTGIDITERQQALARTEFLGRLTQKLSIVSDPGEINRIATREIGQFLSADRCYFFQAMPHTEEVKVLPDWHRQNEPSVEGAYQIASLGRPDWWSEVQLGPVSIDDVRNHEWTKDFSTTYEALNISAYTLVPFIHDGRWVACICVSSSVPRHWTTDEQNLLENALARVWPLIERAHVERSLREVNTLLADKAAHLEALVQERTAKLRETIGDLEAFSYSIAHDMRAPLRSLQSFSEILLTDHSTKLDEEPQYLLRRISSAANRMDKLIQDVLNYSRVMRSDFPLETVEVEQLLHGIVDTYPSFAPEKADIEIQEPIPSVLGNEAMLTQIFSNLMGNAVKFVAPAVKPQLKIWAEPNGPNVRIMVQDNGIGIPADLHERIFGIFQQASKEYEGTGIGLAIAKKAVERMGGAIGLRSEPGQGSTFWIEAQRAAPESRIYEPETCTVRGG